jgi:hypothetical protein
MWRLLGSTAVRPAPPLLVLLSQRLLLLLLLLLFQQSLSWSGGAD